MKISVIYHSVSGNTEKVAGLIASGAEKAGASEVKLMSIDNVDEVFIAESQVIFFGTPTYGGSYSWQMKKWLDTVKPPLAGKIGAVFATENFIGGGADFAEIALANQLLVKGMFVHSVGTSAGKPFTHYGPVSIKAGDEQQQERAVLFGERVVANSMKLVGEKSRA